jgi:tetratricopeptide (TPR) repeat protein
MGSWSLKRPKIAAYCLVAFSLIGGAPRNRLIGNSPERRRAMKPSGRLAELRASIDHGGELYRQGRYQEASELFQMIFAQAQAASLPYAAGRALGNLGGCQFALHQYQSALRSFLEARRLSEIAGDSGVVAVWDANIASLYYVIGEFEAAGEWTRRSLVHISGRDRAEHLPKLQIEMASLRALEGRTSEARELFRQGIDGADRAGDLDLYAIGWNRLGWELLKHGDLTGADAALLEAYRIRKLHHLPLDSSYRSLGRLRLAQGDLSSASTLLDRAVETITAPALSNGQPQTLTPTWDVFYSRALVQMARGQFADALADLRIAQHLGRAWRWSAPASESLQIGAEGMLDQVHSTLVEAGNRLYLETHDPALIRETFAANEENRAVTLRALWKSAKRGAGSSALPDAPPEYWEALNRLQRAEVAALKKGDTTDLAASRAELIRMETSLGGEFRPLPEDLPEATRRKLGLDTALFSYHLGASISWVWALDSEGL